MDFYLKPGIELKEVIVIKKNDKITDRVEMGVLRLQIKEIKNLPTLFGENDIMKSLQLMPGVQSAGEAKSDLFVRGGSNDQNLFLLDDVPLYYISHFGGFFSIFNADAINDVKLIKGGFPARYGSRLSSVLDVRMKDGNLYKYQGQGTLGLLSSRISFEGPIIKGKTSFIISARKNLLPIFKLFFNLGISYNFYDINFKLNHMFSAKDRIYLSFYRGNDKVNVKNTIKNPN